MISINLLPDIKKEYLRSVRIKRLFIFSASAAVIAILAITVLVALYVFGGQRLILNKIQSSIDASQAKLRQVQDLDKILTIQNQLATLPGLHDQKPDLSRLFSYIEQTVPPDVSLAKLDMDLQDQKAILTGKSVNFKSINVFVDTLKNARVSYLDRDGNRNEVAAFADVTVKSYGRDSEATTFQLTLSYDPIIFDNTVSEVKMIIPNITSSPSVTERPAALFQEQQSGGTQENGQ